MPKPHEPVTIYHNPRCSKSRAALALLRENGIEPEVIEYLKTPPSAAKLRELVAMLGIKPDELVRTGEDLFKEKFKGRTLTDAQWIEALAENPILIERPIVVRADRAVLGRPPEKALELF